MKIALITADASLEEALTKQLGQTALLHHLTCSKNYQTDFPKSDVYLVDFSAQEEHATSAVTSLSAHQPHALVIVLHQAMDAEIILKAVRSGAKEFIQYPKDSDSLIRILQNYTPPAVAHKSASQATVVSVFSAKGGGGASTFAINLGHQLAHTKHQKVVVIDANPQYNGLSHALNLEFPYSLGDVSRTHAHESTPLELRVINKLLQPEHHNPQYLTVCKAIEDDNPPPNDNVWQSALAGLSTYVDWIIVDLPSQIVDAQHQWFIEHSDCSLLLSMMDLPSLNRTRQYLDLAKLYLNNPELKLILNRCDLSSAYKIPNQKLEEAFHYPIFARLTNDWNLCVEATSLGQYLADVKPNAPLVKDIHQIADTLLSTYKSTEIAEHHGKEQHASGFFSSIKSMMRSN